MPTPTTTNLLATPRFFKKKAITFILEEAYGQDPGPTGLANWIEARNVSLTPMDVETAERNIEMPYMGSSGKIMVGTWAKLAYDVALAPSGVKGTAPKWGPLLMACGFAQTVVAGTSVKYNLVSDDIASAAQYCNIAGTLHKMPGTRGSVKFSLKAKSAPMMSFSFDSLYVAPIEDDMPAVSRAGWIIEEGINSAKTGAAKIDGVDLSWSDFNFDLAAKIARINLPGPQLEVAITDRAPAGDITVLAPALSVFNPFALVESGETTTLSTTHGTVEGKKVTIDLKVRITNAAYAEVEGITAYKLSLDLPPDVGNDEIALTLS